MTLLSGKVPAFWHLIALVIVGFSITALAGFQLFVDRFQRPLSPLEFLRPQTWERMIRSLPQTPPAETDEVFWWQEGMLYQGLSTPKPIGKVALDPENTPVFLSPQKDKLAWIQEPNELIIFELATGQVLKAQQLPDSNEPQIIHWGQDNESIFVAQQKETWSIVRMTSGSQEVLQTDITYRHAQLTRSALPVSQYLVFPDCSEICQFGILDIKSGTVNFVPALKENDPDARLEDLVMQFYDETQRVIAYQRVSGDEPYDFFVVNFQQELIQLIELRLPSDRDLTFMGYYPQSQEMAFVSRKETGLDQELLVYSATQPALRTLSSFPQDQSLRLLPVNALYLVNNRELKSIFQPAFREEVGQKTLVTVL